MQALEGTVEPDPAARKDPCPVRAGRAGTGLVPEGHYAGTQIWLRRAAPRGGRCLAHDASVRAPSMQRAGAVAGAARSSPGGRPRVTGRSALPAAAVSVLLEVLAPALLLQGVGDRVRKSPPHPYAPPP